MVTRIDNHLAVAANPVSKSQASQPQASSGFATVFSQVGAPAPVSQYEANVHTALAGGVDVSNNPVQFATAATADALAKKLGGVVREDSLAGNFARSAPERMIVEPNGKAVNAGLVADLFAKYGDAPDGEAWRAINADLGIHS
ncbi:MAG: hypothetical protein M3Z23_14750 [Acidobacteriota bacterium]|nr:hypothetical protein [Acidobacteriota bacterium]